jgi:hypothetical protein
MKILRSLAAVGLMENDLISWSLCLRHKQVQWQQSNLQRSTKDQQQYTPALNTVTTTGDMISPTTQQPSSNNVLETLLRQQLDVMNKFVEQQAVLTGRIQTLEGVNGIDTSDFNTNDVNGDDRNVPRAKRRNSGKKSLAEIWFVWYTTTPPLWISYTSIGRQRFHDYKMTVAFMRLFLPGGFNLDRKSHTFANDVDEIGREAERALVLWLASQGQSTQSYGTALKTLRRSLQCGALDNHITQLRALVNAGNVVDPTPIHLIANIYSSSTSG